MIEHEQQSGRMSVSLAASPVIPSPAPEEHEALPESLGERKQWITDLKLQMEMSTQAATTCGRIGRRWW